MTCNFLIFFRGKFMRQLIVSNDGRNFVLEHWKSLAATIDRAESNGTGSVEVWEYHEIERLLARYPAEPTLAVFTVTSIRIPEFYEIVDMLAFTRAIRKSRSARYWPVAIDSIVRTSALISWKTSRILFFYCPTIGMLSARTNNYLIACLNYSFLT